MLEGWTVLAALAGATATVRLGTLVLGNVNRHPAVVANMAATLDHVSGGRFVLGLGAGYGPREHESYGIGLPPRPELLDRFESACAVITSLLTEPWTSFDSPWYRLERARCEPKPVQEKLPVLVGGSSWRTMRIAARFADVWHVWGTPADLRRKNAVVDQACRWAQRDPPSLRRASGAIVRLEEENDGVGRPSLDEPLVSGNASMVIDQLAAYADAGVDEFIWRDHAAVDVSETLEQLVAFTTAVLPSLR